MLWKFRTKKHLASEDSRRRARAALKFEVSATRLQVYTKLVSFCKSLFLQIFVCENFENDIEKTALARSL